MIKSIKSIVTALLCGFALLAGAFWGLAVVAGGTLQAALIVSLVCNFLLVIGNLVSFIAGGKHAKGLLNAGNESGMKTHANASQQNIAELKAYAEAMKGLSKLGVNVQNMPQSQAQLPEAMGALPQPQEDSMPLLLDANGQAVELTMSDFGVDSE